ncbi:LacI family DNA-binding transcriptional regulator [Arthrobacter woluwensis]|uniref:DNA-binding transcriptional regulator, LacI/PurR family n=1 Tax=Arthrobacter woluwensis TaxID=156980 RepID=A0A1H4NPY2_9MICC|nr:LacI family DNA-binding transcriptional regulator [Arthrobacter woluwensis]SEB96918.1 DNA-binding transcriptional regulator, LacI/PurR family [Arthrobacter woluwensis]
MTVTKARPSVYDVAAAAGVSTASISRYFRTPEKLSETLRDRIQSAVQELGYLPSGLARGLAERSTGTLGFYSFSGHEPDEWDRSPAPSAEGEVPRVEFRGGWPRLFPLYADEVLRGIELECTLRRLPLLVGWQDADGRGVALDDIARRSDGLVVLPATIEEAQLRLLAQRLPMVLVSQLVPEGMAASSVRVDDFSGMRALTAHLADDHAARRFAFAGSATGAEHAARHAGFTAALEERGLEVPGEPLVDAGSRSATYAAVTALLTAEPAFADRLPDAIVCSSDQTALGVQAALVEHGIAVPGDVAVTGFDGIDAARLADPPLTTVRQPMDELGRVAVELLTEALEAPGTARHMVLPVAMLLGRSCGCA